MPKSTKRRRSRTRRPGFFQKNKRSLILLAGAGVLLLVLIFFAQQIEDPAPAPVVEPQADYSRQLYAEVDSFLDALGIEERVIQKDQGQNLSRYLVSAEAPDQSELLTLSKRLSSIPGGYSLLIEDQETLHIDRAGQPLVSIRFVGVETRPDGALMTIIMDDLGRSITVAEEVAALTEPVTFSILPGEARAVEVARVANAAGREVMMHVPMEPQGYPAVNPGMDALFVKHGAQDIKVRMDQFFARVPYAAGANNHMGSRFTEDADALIPVMEIMKDRGLFFVDSLTTGQSKVIVVADNIGVPALSRDVFLDNVADVDAIIGEIRHLETRARQQGQAIGICHPYPETLEALRRELPQLKARGISIVPVSRLIKSGHGS